MKQVMLESDYDDYQLLCCPQCGFSGGLHHDSIVVFDRVEDANFTCVTQVDNMEVSIEEITSELVNNPSSRRHGLAIGFSCEACSLNAELTLAQHKGTTEIAWRHRQPDHNKTSGLSKLAYSGYRHKIRGYCAVVESK